MGASWMAEVCQAPTGLLPAMLQWIWESNRSHLVPLEGPDRLDFLGTPYQYLLISAPPEQEAEFQALKREHGSKFGYHGSPVENWHSILRQGLKNASGTGLQAHGAA